MSVIEWDEVQPGMVVEANNTATPALTVAVRLLSGKGWWCLGFPPNSAEAKARQSSPWVWGEGFSSRVRVLAAGLDEAEIQEVARLPQGLARDWCAKRASATT